MVKALRKVEMRALLAPAAPDVDAAAIQRELADIDAKRIHYATMLADDEMDDAQFKAANKRLAARRAALEEQLPAPVSPVAQRILDVPPETVANEWALLDQDEKRALIDAGGPRHQGERLQGLAEEDREPRDGHRDAEAAGQGCLGVSHRRSNSDQPCLVRR
ncbi:hypothetical protein U6Q08_12120 [Cutibacterium acnes]